jgi:pimeloyl-ACP methyl ester carboxylesterase
MKKSSGLLIILILAILTMLAGLAGLIHLNSAFRNQEILSFTGPDGDELAAAYIPGSRDVGVLFLEGFGSDQIAMRPAASVFLETGAHVFTFDFSGHGQSSGTLGFDNAATDRLARQVIAASEAFMARSGLKDSQIIYFGHSLGARVALQSAVLDPAPPVALVLLGTQVNLGTNVQAEFFTGTSDADLAWVQELDPDTPKTNVILLSGSWDDILTPNAALALMGKLTGVDYEAPSAPPALLSGGEPGTARYLTIAPNVFHNYEIYSTAILRQATLYLGELGLISLDEPISLSHYYLFWLLALGGLLAALIIAPLWLQRGLPAAAPRPVSTGVLRLRRFLWGKLLLWLAALPIAALLTGLFFLIPLGLPVFNMIYVGFIGGYGILMLVLYLLGKAPGTQGKWRLKRDVAGEKGSWKDLIVWGGFLLWGVVLLALVIITRSGIYYVIAHNQRLAWLAIFTPVTALGFWIGAREDHMLNTFRHEAGRHTGWARFALSLIGLTPFFIYTIFMGILGSISGMVGGLQGLLTLAIILLTGKTLSHFIRRRWMVALLQAILLYALILPQGVLFAF